MPQQTVTMEKVELVNTTSQSYMLKESMRTLRTNLQFCGDDICTLMITSAAPDEGKTSITVNFARSLTESGKRVLIIDTDMRKSVMVSRLGVRRTGGELYGLSHYLTGQKRLHEVVYATQIPRLCMVFSGPTVPNPTEILEKKYFEDLIRFARNCFDYVLIDCPPIGAVIDAAVIAPHCDAAIMVVAQGEVSARLINESKKQLEASGIRILGAVLNKVEMSKSGYYSKYYSKYYGKYYGNEEGKKE